MSVTQRNVTIRDIIGSLGSRDLLGLMLGRTAALNAPHDNHLTEQMLSDAGVEILSPIISSLICEQGCLPQQKRQCSGIDSNGVARVFVKKPLKSSKCGMK